MTLGDIIQEAMDLINEPALNTESTGRFTLGWWTRRVNGAQRLLAQETGYKVGRFPISVLERVQRSSLPADLCWGIYSVRLGTEVIDPMTEDEADEDYPGWRYASDLPYQAETEFTLAVDSLSDDDTAVSITIHGLSGAGAYLDDTLALNGTTPVESVHDYAEIWYAELNEAAVGKVRLMRSSDSAIIGEIAVGETLLGTAPSTDTPTKCVIVPPAIEWYPVPDADYTAYLRGGRMPSEFSVPGSLGAATATPDGLPAAYHDLLVYGAVALAETADLFGAEQQGRLSEAGRAFLSGIAKLNGYLDRLYRERSGALKLSTVGQEHYL